MRVAATPGPRRRSGMERRALYARAAAVAVGLAFVVSVAGGSGADAASGRLGGDFPAFYAAGSIVAEGDWDQLYEPERQAAEQRALFSGAEPGYLYFAYPPHVAALYRPLAALDYRSAYIAHSLLMVGAVIAALALVRPVLHVVDDNFELAVIGSLLFYPMLRAVTGGQNTGLTLVLIAGLWRALDDDNDLAAGMCIGLLLYKPQFALPLLVLLGVRGRWRAVASGVATGAVLWISAAVVMGVGWLTTWWTEVSEFARIDAAVNGDNAISWLGFTEHIWGPGTLTARAVAAPLMATTLAALVVAWRWPRNLPGDVRMAATVTGIIMLSNHAMFYDAGLLVLVGLVAIERFGRRAAAPVATVWGLAWTQIASPQLGFAPLFVVTAAVACVALAIAALPPAAATADANETPGTVPPVSF